MDTLTAKLCAELSLTFDDTYDTSRRKSSVCRVRTSNGKPLILKASEDVGGVIEITRNFLGYQRSLELELGRFIPELVAVRIELESAFMLMEYCGLDFFEYVSKIDKPITAYRALIADLGQLYAASSITGSDGVSLAIYVVNKVLDQIGKQFGNSKERISLEKLLKQAIHLLSNSGIGVTCFTHWDFVPKNVHLTPTGVKLVDPSEAIAGIPIIDVAYFAGVSRDVQKLPGSSEAYESLKAFALNDVAGILDINTDLAESIFYLGRGLQCLSYARYAPNPKEAMLTLHKGVDYLARVLA